MVSRVFFTLVGLGAGVAVGVWAIRKVEHTGRQLAPDAVAARAGDRVSDLGDRLTRALEAGRAAAQAKEAELRATYLDEPHAATDTAGGA